jgi:hypothetical protein
MTIEPKAPVLERPAKEFIDATAKPPFNYQIPVSEGRAALESSRLTGVPGRTTRTRTPITVDCSSPPSQIKGAWSPVALVLGNVT